VPFGNYTPPYLYLLAAASPLVGLLPPMTVLKLLSFACMVPLAAACASLLRAMGHARPWRAATAALLAPSLIVSPAILVQCDALWAAAIVAATATAIRRRHAAMFLWCGIGVAIKLQAAFAAPFFLALALARGIPLRTWCWAPAAAVAAMLPAWVAGWPFADLLTIYVRQSQWDDALAQNAPNIWTLAQALPPASMLGIVAPAMAVVGALAFVAIFARRLWDADPIALVRAALLCALIVPGLLPRMHERYFFLSDVLALLLVLVRPSEWRLALLTQVGSCCAILAYVLDVPGLAAIGAAAMLLATWMTAKPMLPRTASVARIVPA
jgi:Gpi18-like mannosyltransferase